MPASTITTGNETPGPEETVTNQFTNLKMSTSSATTETIETPRPDIVSKFDSNKSSFCNGKMTNAKVDYLLKQGQPLCEIVEKLDWVDLCTNYPEENQRVIDKAEKYVSDITKIFSDLEPFDYRNISTIRAWNRCFERFFMLRGREHLYKKGNEMTREVERFFSRKMIEMKHYPLWVHTFNFCLFRELDFLGLTQNLEQEGINSSYGIYETVLRYFPVVLKHDMKAILDYEISSAQIIFDDNFSYNWLSSYQTKEYDLGLYDYYVRCPYYFIIRRAYPNLGGSNKKALSEILVEHYLQTKNEKDYVSHAQVHEDFIRHPDFKEYVKRSAKTNGMSKSKRHRKVDSKDKTSQKTHNKSKGRL